jgi:putative ABC transport system permease protein
VIVSHRLWQGHLGSDPTLIGKALILNGKSLTVVGIMPRGFNVPAEEADVWLPFTPESWGTGLGMHHLSVIARLRPGITLEQSKVEMASVISGLTQKYSEYYKDAAGMGVSIVSLREQLVGDIRLPLLVLLAAVCFILLIACANVANLLLARAAARQKEVAIRTALGASRLRVVRQLLTESLLLSIFGGVSGLLLALWGVRLLAAQKPFNIPRMDEANIDVSVLGFAMLVSILTGVIFGLAPALQSSKPDLNESLKEGSRGTTQGSGTGRTRSLLVVSELALSVVLLIGAGLMIRSFQHLLQVKLGFNPQNVLTAQLSLPQLQYAENQRVTAFYQQLLQRIDALPGVQGAAAVNNLPLAADTGTASFEIEGKPLKRESDGLSPIADYHIISPGYFHTMSSPPRS